MKKKRFAILGPFPRISVIPSMFQNTEAALWAPSSEFMSYRIYIDESGTHDDRYLIIGILFVPEHGALHAELCKCKDVHSYFNRSPKHSHKYREVHFTKCRSPADIAIGKCELTLLSSTRVSSAQLLSIGRFSMVSISGIHSSRWH